jgi:hypothetical protein
VRATGAFPNIDVIALAALMLAGFPGGVPPRANAIVIDTRADATTIASPISRRVTCGSSRLRPAH